MGAALNGQKISCGEKVHIVKPFEPLTDDDEVHFTFSFGRYHGKPVAMSRFNGTIQP